ncbi:hypothetical protein CCR75_004048 [Bremia lactucae]|uniref:Spindle pole body component n=1 Tax=Bremia lactucae TaxID=4779 RepID=A0A976IBF0_BRELC|nr:hypothetical protein CCR75_004048 [Bremia lactucae]
MNAERQSARLKRRAERLGPPPREHCINNGIRHSSVGSSDVNSAHAHGSSDPICSSDNFRRQPTPTSSTTAACRTLSDRSPRDINTLVGKLLNKIYGAPSSMTTRRTVVRLIDSMATAQQTDALTVLEKIKRKISADATQFYSDSQATVMKLNEVYSRFVRLKNLDNKTEALLLLYGLMDTTPPPMVSRKKSNHLENAAAMSIDSNMKEPMLDASGSATSGSHDRSESMPAPLLNLENHSVPPAASITMAATDVELLEESFKFAVGIAQVNKPSRGKSSSPRTHARMLDSESKGIPNVALECLTFDVPEEVLMRDVFYALQAIESRYLYFDNAADRFQIIKSAGVPKPMRELIYMQCELGWVFRKISEYIKQHRRELAYGLVGQSFCHVLNTELANYYRLIAVLAAQIDDDVETRQPHERRTSNLTLRTLSVWLRDPLDKMRLIARLIDSVEGLRGGALASGVHSHVLHGDPGVSQFVQRIAAPLVRMIKRWVFEGELDDRHVSKASALGGEFFVVADPSVSDDQFWDKSELAKKILVIGKSINFIRQCCGNADWVMDAAKEAAVIGVEFDNENAYVAELKRLEAVIENVSNSTNKYLIRSLTEKFQLLDHCLALKRYLLLGQGDFIQYLMDLLGPELSKRGSQVYRHTLTNVLETALNASNAKFESADILGRLDVELLQGSPVSAVHDNSSLVNMLTAETGWDIFCLHYNLQAPVNSVIPATSIFQYQQIFSFLWRMKRIEHSLSASWSKDMNLGHEVQGCVPGIRPVLHKSQLMRSEMIHFITNLLNYMMFEVLETAWHKLVKDLNAAKDLDGLIESHRAYIYFIKNNGFMMKESRDLLKQLKLMFSTIIRFCKAQENLYTSAMHEKHVVRKRLLVMRRQEFNNSALLAKDKNNVQVDQDTFAANSKIMSQVEEISDDFCNQFIKLLDIIKQDSTR